MPFSKIGVFDVISKCAQIWEMASGLRNWPPDPSIRDKIEFVQNPPRQYTKCEIFLIILVVAVLMSVAAVAIAAIVVNANYGAVTSYCPSFNGTVGYIQFNSNGRTISWYIQYPAAVGPTPTNLYVRGPIQPGMTTAPIYFSICGYPSSLACDLSIPGVLSGQIFELNPGGSPLTPIIAQVQSNPSLYYVTSNNVTLGGLGALC